MENFKSDLSNVITQTEEPLLLSSYLKWDIFNWDLQKWNEVLGNENLEFRCGKNAKTKGPQWEKTTEIITGTFDNILKLSEPDKWLYFDYKYLNEWLLKAKELREQINFEDLGLKNVTIDESTIWIGTKGAHTPCHIDTYGCNVVVQIYGQKLWLLFKPDENLKASRVPYEESTIYSKLNFFSPSNISDFEDIHNSRLIIMKPGDVLIIPNKWWHYVEALETSISINTWLPLQQDHKERQRECLLQLLMGSILQNVDGKIQTSFLNPNSYDLLQTSLNERIDFLKEILKVPLPTSNVPKVETRSDLDEFLEKHPFLKRIENIGMDKFKKFLENQSKRFAIEESYEEEQVEKDVLLKRVTHAITHPDVIDLILKKILE